MSSNSRLTSINMIVGMIVSVGILAVTYVGVAYTVHWWPFVVPAPPPVVACGRPAIVLDPDRGPVNTTVAVHGCGFGREEQVTVSLGEDTVADARTDADGAFDAAFPVPSSYSGHGPSDLIVIAQGQTSQSQNSAIFALTVR